MKSIVLIIQFVFFSSFTFSQCVEISFLTQLFKESLEKQDQMLEAKGFTINENNIGDLEMDWVNTKTDQYICIRRNNTNKVDRVRYRLKGDFECYEGINSKLSSQGFNKEYETIGSYSTFYFFYKSESYGIVLLKWKAPQGYVGNFYLIEVHSLRSYNKELKEKK